MKGGGMNHYQEHRVSTLQCSMDFTDMPFDSQTCKVTLYIPGSNVAEMMLSWVETTSEQLSNAEWTINQGSDWTLSEENDTREEWGNTAVYSTLTAEIKLERNPGYLVQNFVNTVVLFYILSYMGFWLSPDAVPARVAAGVIPVLTTSNKMSSLSATLPPISYSTRLGTLMNFNLYIIVIHFVEYGAIQWAGRRVKSDAKRKADIADDANKWVSDELLPVVQKEPAPQRFQSQLAHVLNAYGEIFMRIASPTVYIVGMVAICYA